MKCARPFNPWLIEHLYSRKSEMVTAILLLQQTEFNHAPHDGVVDEGVLDSET